MGIEPSIEHVKELNHEDFAWVLFIFKWCFPKNIQFNKIYIHNNQKSSGFLGPSFPAFSTNYRNGFAASFSSSIASIVKFNLSSGGL